jgi:uncharacterized membrane protein YphA (DoxX/SURF4 family)
MAFGWIVLVARVFLGALFIFAAVMKLSNPQSFAEAINAFKILPDHLVVLATFVVPWIEAVLGVALILGLWTRSAALVLSLLLVAFIAALVSVLDKGITCSCFGKFEIPCSGPVGWCHVIRNTVLLALAALVVAKGPGSLAIDRESTK